MSKETVLLRQWGSSQRKFNYQQSLYYKLNTVIVSKANFLIVRPS